MYKVTGHKCFGQQSCFELTESYKPFVFSDLEKAHEFLDGSVQDFAKMEPESCIYLPPGTNAALILRIPAGTTDAEVLSKEWPVVYAIFLEKI